MNSLLSLPSSTQPGISGIYCLVHVRTLLLHGVERAVDDVVEAQRVIAAALLEGLQVQRVVLRDHKT